MWGRMTAVCTAATLAGLVLVGCGDERADAKKSSRAKQATMARQRTTGHTPRNPYRNTASRSRSRTTSAPASRETLRPNPALYAYAAEAEAAEQVLADRTLADGTSGAHDVAPIAEPLSVEATIAPTYTLVDEPTPASRTPRVRTTSARATPTRTTSTPRVRRTVAAPMHAPVPAPRASSHAVRSATRSVRPASPVQDSRQEEDRWAFTEADLLALPEEEELLDAGIAEAQLPHGAAPANAARTPVHELAEVDAATATRSRYEPIQAMAGAPAPIEETLEDLPTPELSPHVVDAGREKPMGEVWVNTVAVKTRPVAAVSVEQVDVVDLPPLEPMGPEIPLTQRSETRAIKAARRLREEAAVLSPASVLEVEGPELDLTEGLTPNIGQPLSQRDVEPLPPALINGDGEGPEIGMGPKPTIIGMAR